MRKVDKEEEKVGGGSFLSHLSNSGRTEAFGRSDQPKGKFFR